MLEAMLREAQWEMELEQLYHEFFGGRGDFPIYEKYEWSSGDLMTSIQPTMTSISSRSPMVINSHGIRHSQPTQTPASITRRGFTLYARRNDLESQG